MVDSFVWTLTWHILVDAMTGCASLGNPYSMTATNPYITRDDFFTASILWSPAAAEADVWPDANSVKVSKRNRSYTHLTRLAEGALAARLRACKSIQHLITPSVRFSRFL